MFSFSQMRAMRTDIQWPQVFTDRAAVLAALLGQLEEIRNLSAIDLARAQSSQLASLVRHAATHSPHFLERLEAADMGWQDFDNLEALKELPVLTRDELQMQNARAFCTHVPPLHSPVRETGTSGSTGQPVQIKRTELNQLFWEAFTIREHLWQKRDFRGTLAVIRANLPAEGVSMQNWGNPVNLLYDTGPAHAIPSNWPIPKQAAWLQQVAPQYLLTYPTNLAALLDYFEKYGVSLPSLSQVRTVGETVSKALRARTASILGVGIADIYSSQEFGTMAIQRRDLDTYHLMSEGYIIEILDADKQPCQPGQIGRVIVTDLHNYATPLIRYDTGDFAQLSADLNSIGDRPMLQRVMGRKRNMVLINGTLRWPTLNAYTYRDIAPIRQYQLIQVAVNLIEVRLVCSPLTAIQEKGVADIIHEGLDHPFPLVFRYFDAPLPLGRTGKFEEFLNLVA